MPLLASLRTGLAALCRKFIICIRLPDYAYYINGPETLPPPLSKEEEKVVFAGLEAGNPDCRDVLIVHNLRLVVYIAKKFESKTASVEDMISIGTIGLIKAVNTFVPSKNIKLATYASRCIENEILMHFRSQRKSQGEVSLSDAIDGEGEGNALSLMDTIRVDDNMLEDLDPKDACLRVRQYVRQCLEPREAAVIALRYGLNERTPLTQREVAAQCGISRSYVSRIEKKALKKLEEAMNRGG